jgi:hypothetical protein
MQAIIQMSTCRPRAGLPEVFLPREDQLSMHVNAQEFLDRVAGKVVPAASNA